MLRTYFALAAIQLSVIAILLIANRRTTAEYAVAVRTSHHATAGLRLLGAADSALDDVVSPAHDAFRGEMDAISAQKAMDAAVVAYEHDIKAFAEYLKESDSPRQTLRLGALRRDVQELIEREREVFSYVRAGQLDHAAAAMVATEDALRDARGILSSSLTSSSSAHEDALDRAHEHVGRMDLITAVITALLMALLVAVAIHGLRMSRHLIRMMSAQKQAEEDLRAANVELAELSARSASILAAAGDGIIGVDRFGKPLFVNPSASQLTGYGLEDLSLAALASSVVPLWSGDSPAGARRAEFTRKDGSRFPAEYIVSTVTDDGSTTGYVVVFRDVSERTAVERMKDEFVSIVSHELRTPLTSIRGSLGLLAGGLLGTVPLKAQRMLDIAVTNTDRLVRLINDILDIERMESGKVTLSRTRVRIADVVEAAVDVVRPLADRGGVVIVTEPIDAEVFVDADRITQTLTNLLSNAVKFSPEASVVTVAGSVAGRDLTLTVADQGRGIPPEKLASVFERFEQVDASDSREKGGSGLGLAICRSIVTQHGGTIRARSMVGEGSVFEVVLPCVTAHAGARERLCVAVCDDDPAVRELLQEMLERQGYASVSFPDGAALMESVVDLKPAAILLDLVMPRMNGWETLCALREKAATADIPVIIASVEAPESGKYPRGVAGWIQKPLNDEDLTKVLAGAVAEGRRASVLIVEDDADLAGVINAMFERLGVATLHAADGAAAAELARMHQFDLVVLDVALPQLDGFEVVAALRQTYPSSAVPLIVYTALELDAADRDRLRLGPTEFFTKTRVSPEQFEHSISCVLRAVSSGWKERTDEHAA